MMDTLKNICQLKYNILAITNELDFICKLRIEPCSESFNQCHLENRHDKLIILYYWTMFIILHTTGSCSYTLCSYSGRLC